MKTEVEVDFSKIMQAQLQCTWAGDIFEELIDKIDSEEDLESLEEAVQAWLHRRKQEREE